MALAMGLPPGSFTRPSWKEQDLGSWVQACVRYLHQWQPSTGSPTGQALGTEAERHIIEPVCAQSRKPKTLGPSKTSLMVGETTLTHSGRADLVKNPAPSSPSPQEAESLWHPPFQSGT